VSRLGGRASRFFVYHGDVEDGPGYRLDEIGGVRTLDCLVPSGKKIQAERDAIELIGEALGHRAQMIVIPTERLTQEFFRLRTGVAGDIVQKFVQYRRRLVIVGDITRYLTDSSAFASFVTEANRGNDIWFMPDLRALERRLEEFQGGQAGSDLPAGFESR